MEWKDRSGGTAYRYVQTYNGIRVWGGYVVSYTAPTQTLAIMDKNSDKVTKTVNREKIDRIVTLN
jgi:hypothetical protein